MSLTSGSDTLPSGRTGTVRLNSGFFQTEISSTSSGPIRYADASSSGVGVLPATGLTMGAVGGVLTVGGVSTGGGASTDAGASGDAGAEVDGVAGAAASAGDEAAAGSGLVDTGSSVAAGTSVVVRGVGS